MGWPSKYEDDVEMGVAPYTCFFGPWTKKLTHLSEFTALRQYEMPIDITPIKQGILVAPFMDFLKAAKREHLVSIPQECLDKPPYWIQKNEDGSIKIGRNGRPVIKTSKEIPEYVKLLIYNFTVSFQKYFLSSVAAMDNKSEQLQESHCSDKNSPTLAFMNTVRQVLLKSGVPEYLEVNYVDWICKLSKTTFFDPPLTTHFDLPG